jgi:hypothetical protein
MSWAHDLAGKERAGPSSQSGILANIRNARRLPDCFARLAQRGVRLPVATILKRTSTNDSEHQRTSTPAEHWRSLPFAVVRFFSPGFPRGPSVFA